MAVSEDMHDLTVIVRYLTLMSGVIRHFIKTLVGHRVGFKSAAAAAVISIRRLGN